MSNHSRRQQKKHSHTPLRVINLFLLVIFILLSVVSLFLMYLNKSALYSTEDFFQIILHVNKQKTRKRTHLFDQNASFYEKDRGQPVI